MGRRSKRKKLILRKLNAGQEVPDQDLIRNGLGRIVEENSVRIQKLKEAQEAEESDGHGPAAAYRYRPCNP